MADLSVWHEVYSKGNMPKDGDLVDHHEPVAADLAGNVYSFGLLMLEIISGKPPYSEEKGSLANLVMTTIWIITSHWNQENTTWGIFKYPKISLFLSQALECIRDNRSMSCLLDPNLKAHKENDLEIICELVQDCLQNDPKKRPTMRDITTRLREVISISPEAATPRLSPLWWAELEILSVEAS